ncbi:MAG: RNA-directed DNA polymerase, partial [Patescibacteria group bacterium]
MGNLTSQLFANVYLNELDQFVKHELKAKYYIRYTDDFVVVHHDLQYLWELKNRIEVFLKSRLRMELHPHKVSVRKCTQGIDFLGYILLPHAQLVRTKTRRRMVKKIRERVHDFKNEKISEDKLLQSIHSYFGALGHANTYKLQQELKHLVW